MPQFNTVVIHYGEIGTKLGNRIHFEKLLLDNIKAKTKGLVEKYHREFGQISMDIKSSNAENLRDILSRIPGIIYFSFATRCGLEIDDIAQCVLEYVKDLKFETFRVTAQRHCKNVKYTSMELNALIGEAVINKYDKKVKMKSADLNIKIEISGKYAHVSSEEIPGVGGLPVNEKQKVVALLSGGFDSPVAAYLMMKRGCEVILVHFQNQNQTTCAVENKITELAKQLSRYQNKTKLYIVPFEELQKEIILKTQAESRMLIYRRFMIKISAAIAKKENAKFLVMGDSMSQVASQTIHNLEATYAGSDIHILSPVIGLDKTEIIALARKIGTSTISEQPYADCCSYFVPKHPELKSTSGSLRKEEDKFDADKLVEAAIATAKILEF